MAKLHADSIAYVENVLQGEKFEEKFAEYLIETSITEDNEWFLCGLRVKDIESIFPFCCLVNYFIIRQSRTVLH